MGQPWRCELCSHPIDEVNRSKAQALRDFHMRTRHGAQAPRTYGSPKSGKSGSSGIVGDIAEAIGEGIGKTVGKIIDAIID